jgi:hypothetical protein
MFLRRFLEVLEDMECVGGRRCRNNKVERVIEEVIRREDNWPGGWGNWGWSDEATSTWRVWFLRKYLRAQSEAALEEGQIRKQWTISSMSLTPAYLALILSCLQTAID